MSSISLGLPQIHDLGLEQAPEESQLDQGSKNPQNLWARARILRIRSDRPWLA
jgi:hypothetical protein